MKTKIEHKEISGKVICISEEKDRSKLNIILDNSQMEVDAEKEKYKLGDKIDMDVNIEVTWMKKQKQQIKV